MAASKSSGAVTTILVVAAVLGVLYELWVYFSRQSAAGAGSAVGGTSGGSLYSPYSPYGTGYGTYGNAPTQPTDPVNGLLAILAEALKGKGAPVSLSNNLPQAGFGGLLQPSNVPATAFINWATSLSDPQSVPLDTSGLEALDNQGIPYIPLDTTQLQLPQQDLPPVPTDFSVTPYTDVIPSEQTLDESFDGGGDDLSTAF